MQCWIICIFLSNKLTLEFVLIFLLTMVMYGRNKLRKYDSNQMFRCLLAFPYTILFQRIAYFINDCRSKSTRNILSLHIQDGPIGQPHFNRARFSRAIISSAQNNSE